MRHHAGWALLVVLALLAPGCTQLIPGSGGNQEDANAWAHRMVQSDRLRGGNLSGEGVKLAVVDTGVAAGHQELSGVSVTWRDFVNGQAEPYDDHGHGTHVSGLAVAQSVGGLDGPAIQGVAPGADLLHAKAIQGGGRGGNSGDVADAIDWSVRQGAHVIVLSLGQAPRLLSIGDQVEMAVQRAIDQGVVVVAAAGNAQEGESGEDCQVASPADMQRVIAVGAVDRERQIAPFSCTGGDSSGPLGVMQREDPHKKPEVTAPGVGLVGPWPGRACGDRSAQYCVLSGTSQATPIVGGVVALLLEEHPELRRDGPQAVDRIKRALTETAEKVGFSGHHARYGYGILQGQAALTWLENNPPQEDGVGPIPPPTIAS